MAKVGVLVLGNQAPLILDKVLDNLDQRLFRVFLHVDAKRNLSEYTQHMHNLDKVTLVEPRTVVFWGGFSMVEAEMTMIRAALADPDISTFVVLSDDAVPVRRSEIIHAALVATPDRISLEVRNDPQVWYRGFFMPDSRLTAYREEAWWEKTVEPEDVSKFQRLLAAYERGKKDIGLIYFSRQWWSLSRVSLMALVSDIEQDDHLLESFRFSAVPDETLFPTLYRLRHPSVTTLGVPMFNQFTPHCRTFHNEGDLVDIKISPEHLFMRKISPNSSHLVELAATLGDAIAVSVQLCL